jgi:hypothetical protein
MKLPQVIVLGLKPSPPQLLCWTIRASTWPLKLMDKAALRPDE